VNLAPFLQRTGQLWKLLLGCGVIAMGLLGVFALLLFRQGRLPDEVAGALLIGANVANLCAAVWMVRAIRCPRCKARLLWHAVRAQSHPQGLHWFLTFVVCPYCKFEPALNSVSASPADDTTP
jgi:hypothetical protein